MSGLSKALEKGLRRVDALTLRERLLVFAAVLIVVGGLWHVSINAPLEARRKLAVERIATLKERFDQGNKSMTAAAEGIGAEMVVSSQRLSVLRQQADTADGAVRELMTNLVDADQMRLVLEDLLRRQPGLRLVSATSLEATPLFDEPKDAEAVVPSDAPRLYSHGLVLTLEGSYLDYLRYLRAIEQLPWRLHWARLDLQVDEYPKSKLVIEIHTLSLEPEWIRV